VNNSPQWKSAGKVTGGSMKIDNNLQALASIGGDVTVREGRINADGDVRLYLQNATLLNYGKRAVYPYSTLSSLTFEGGTDSDSIQLVGSKINEIEWTFRQGEILQVALKLLALYALQSTGGIHANLPDMVFTDFEGKVTWDSLDYDVMGGRVTLNNNLKRGGALKSRTGTLRKNDYIQEGLEATSAEIELLSEYTTSIVGTTVNEVILDVDFTNGSSHRHRVQVNSCKVGTRSFEFAGGDNLVVHRLEIPHVPPNKLTITDQQ